MTWRIQDVHYLATNIYHTDKKDYGHKKSVLAQGTGSVMDLVICCCNMARDEATDEACYTV